MMLEDGNSNPEIILMLTMLSNPSIFDTSVIISQTIIHKYKKNIRNLARRR